MRRFSDLSAVLTGWWLLAACVGFAAVPVVQAEEWGNPAEVEILTGHPQCSSEGELAAKLHLRNAAIDVSVRFSDGFIPMNVRVRRGGIVEDSGIPAVRGSTGSSGMVHRFAGNLNAVLILCMSPLGFSVAEAEWSLLAETDDVTLTSTSATATGEFEAGFFNLGAHTGQAVLRWNDRAAELTDRSSEQKQTVEIDTLVAVNTKRSEPQE